MFNDVRKNLVFFGLATLVATQVTAQDNNTDDVLGVLEEIIVTAQRREQSLQDTAISLEVLDDESLTNVGVTRASDLTKMVPGLQIGNSGPSPQVYLRGVGDFSSTSINSPAVPFYVDGVYVARSHTGGAELYDLERVEVLKGPQGTLYGRNASGGAINLITKRPVLDELSGNASIEVGGYDGRDFGENVLVTGAVNIPFGENTAARVALNFIDKDGYVAEDLGAQENYSGRIRLLHEPNDQLNVMINASVNDIGGTGAATTLENEQFRGDFQSNTEGVGREFLLETIAFGPFGPILYTPVTEDGAFQDLYSYNFSTEINYDFGPATLTVVPAYRFSETTFNIPVNFQFLNGVAFNTVNLNGEPTSEVLPAKPELSKATSLEVRLAGETDRLNWVAGGFYYDEEQYQQFGAYQGRAQSALNQFEQSTDSFAFFGQTTLSMTDTFRLILGARYTEDQRTIDGRSGAINQSLGCGFAFPPPPGLVVPGQPDFCVTDRYEGDKTFDDFSWKVGFEADVLTDSFLYGAATRGFKAGGFNTQSVDGSPTVTGSALEFDQEILTSYEIGLKNNLLNGRLQLNAEVFFWDYEDHQEPTITESAAGSINLSFLNAGAAEIYGLSINSIGKFWEGGTITAGIEVLESEYTEFEYEVPAGNFIGKTQCETAPVGSTGAFSIDCSGFEVARAPDLTFNLSLDQEFHVGDALIVGNAYLTYVSERFTAIQFNDGQRADAYTMLDLTATYYHPGDVWNLSVFARNATNEQVVTNTANHNFSDGVTGTPLPSRSYGLRLAAKF